MEKRFDETAFKAAIFDMDGTLLDSMGSWRALNAAYVRSRGIEPTPQQARDMESMSGMMVVHYFKDEFGIDCTFDELCGRACDAMRAVYAAGVPLKPGAFGYLRRLGERGVVRVLATATPAEEALIGLNKAGLVGELDYIYSTDMIGKSKSDPAFFDALCSQIGVAKENCVMFEDALYAMRGAREAGLLGVVGITDDTNRTDRAAIYEVCDKVIDSYDELK